MDPEGRKSNQCCQWEIDPVPCVVYERHLSLSLSNYKYPLRCTLLLFSKLLLCVSSPSYGLQGLCWVVPPNMHWHSMLGGSKLNAFLQHS